MATQQEVQARFRRNLFRTAIHARALAAFLLALIVAFTARVYIG